MSDYRELDRRAVEGSAVVARNVTAAHLDRPTPCGAWTVLDLLEHMSVQHYGFAAAARGAGADPATWRPVRLGTDPAAAYLAACAEVIGAFAEDGALERRWQLPEISAELTFPAAQAMSFHFVDYVVHAWDLAVAIGSAYDPDDDLLAAALVVAEAVPIGAARLAPGAAFGPVLEPADDARSLERVLRRLGRSPQWPTGSVRSS